MHKLESRTIVYALWAAFPALLLGAAWAAAEEPSKKAKADPCQWRDLFDGKTLDGWKTPKFGGEGKVKVQEGAIVLGMGDPMTGIAWSGDFPKVDYEVTLDAKKTEGDDFFATATFPVGDSFCSFVTGGWAGTVTGLSSIDYIDASENSTTGFKNFEKDRWYRFRIRVTKAKIECWIDDQKTIDFVTTGHKISLRFEVDPCRPFGFSSYMTEGRLRKIRLRQLTPAESAAVAAETSSEKE
jgi:hypothetical protein